MDPLTIALIGGGMSALGGLFGGISQGKSNAASLAENKRQFDASNALNQQQLTNQSTQLDPLAQQKKRAQFALLASLLPGFSNFSVQAPSGMSQFVPQMSGGLQLPSGGIDPSVLKYFSPDSAAAAETDFGALTKNGVMLSALGYPTSTSSSSSRTPNYTQLFAPRANPSAGRA